MNNKKVARAAGHAEIRANRSGKVPSVIVGILSAAGIIYDEQHLHIVHHIFGKISWIFAVILVTGLILLTRMLFRHEAGHVEISSKEEGE